MRKLVEIKGVGQVLATALAEKGFHSVQDIADATETELSTVSGVSTTRAALLISCAKSLLAEDARPEHSSQASAADATPTPLQFSREPGEKRPLPAAAIPARVTTEGPASEQPARRSNGGSSFDIAPPANDSEKKPLATELAASRSTQGTSKDTASASSDDGKAKKKSKKKKKGAKEKTALAEKAKPKKNKKKIKKGKKSDSKKGTSKNKKNKKKKGKDKTQKKKSKSRKKK